MNKLYFGDNLIVLREHLANESVDLIYLDPPFNSNKNYNILFNSPKGQKSEAQITAFEDTWHWGDEAEREYTEILHQPNTNVAEMIQSFRKFLSTSDMMAYITMMTIRLLELHRVLKPTGSLYLHCDPTASHYLKVMLDIVFGEVNFRNEIVWRRTNSHNKLTRQFGPIHDTILFYSKTMDTKFHPGTRPYSRDYIEDRFKYHDSVGRYQTNYLTGPGTRKGESGLAWRGFDPTGVGRHWAIPASLRDYLPNRGKDLSTKEKLECLYEQGFVVFPQKEGGQPMYKQYLGKGVQFQDIWAYQPNTKGVLFESNECIDEDVKYLENEKEMLDYPTQKPVGLLERILITSSDEGDVVLDPFCGCGTAVEAAQKLDRQWIGIDITSLAITLIEKRLRDRYPGIQYEVIGTPKDLEGARDLANRDKYQFQWWACSLVNAQPYQGKKKGADSGIDGLIFFQDDRAGAKKIIVSVKGGESVGVSQIRDLIGTVDREKAAIGLFITLAEPTRPMQTEAVSASYYESPLGKSYPKIQILTIEGLLSGQQKAEYPDLARGGLTFKPVKPAEKDTGQLHFGL